MNNLFKVSGLIVVIALGGTGYYMYKNGLNPLNANDLKHVSDTTKSKIDKISDAINEKTTPPKESKVYKRKDEQGNWYYSNDPPKEGEEAEETTYRSDTNVLPPLPEDNNKKK